MNNQKQSEFFHLFERVGEPLYFSPRGRNNDTVIYNVPQSACREVQDAAQVARTQFSGTTGARTVAIAAPTTTPNLSSISRNCSRSALYNYFNPQHRAATKELREIFLSQRNLDQLLSIASVCRDSPQINCKLWINAFASCLLSHPQTKNFRFPAVWEVMPDLFFSSFAIRQAFRQAEMPERDRGTITVDNPQTANNDNPENRVAYWREDIGLNSHHWHWHLVYRLDDGPLQGRRKGELFYYMHHFMIARYDAERLANNLPRVRPLSIDDNPILKEGYFPKLFDTNSGQNWGTRQNNTPLVNINRTADQNLPVNYRVLTLEQLRKFRDRIMEAIDTGVVNGSGNQRIPLNIDILGDIVEASALSPNPQFYGADGFHNIGHMMIAHAHDPEYKHAENAAVMADTTANMRDPIFHKWHKYVDVIFEAYLKTLKPYQPTGGELPLIFPNVEVKSISVQHASNGARANVLQTYFMQSHVDLSRGLDFTRTDQNRLGAIWLRFSHLNHDPFNYTIVARNNGNGNLRATVRIFLAPRLNEHGERFIMQQQRKMFFEMDKFVQQLRPGDNTITRSSLDSDLTVPWEQTFRDLERGVAEPTAAQSICGCGWAQHMLLPRGTPSGMLFDLVVFLTNAEDDAVPGAAPPSNNRQGNCRESLSLCGRLNQPYPDRKPMGYPFDRIPFTVADQANPRVQVPVQSLEQYTSRIPNMLAVQITIIHDRNKKVIRQDGGPGKVREISGDPSVNATEPTCPDQGQMPSGGGSGGNTRQNPGPESQDKPQYGWSWDRGMNQNRGHNHYYSQGRNGRSGSGSSSSSPQGRSPNGSRSISPNWEWME